MRREAAPHAAGWRSAGVLSRKLLAVLVCLVALPQARAGTFISGSVRWEKVDATTARFDVVTYWRRSFSPFEGGRAVPGDKLDVIAQSTVSLNYGDGSAPHFLRANVTNINEDEDWLESVTTYEHKYSAPYAKKEMKETFEADASGAPVTERQFKAVYTPWMVRLHGCCRYNTLSNDPDKPFELTAAVNLETSSRSPDPRILPLVSVKPGGTFKASITAPLYRPEDMVNSSKALVFEWCPSSAWTHPGAAAVSLNPGTGIVTWVGSTEGSWYHLCVKGSIDDVTSEVDVMVYVLPAATLVPTCTSEEFDGDPPSALNPKP